MKLPFVPEPHPFFANLQRGSMLLNANRPKDALPYFQAAIAADPDSPLGYAELARCYNELPGQRGKSIRAIDRAIALAPTTSRYFGLKGWFLVCLTHYRRAFTAAQQGLAINPICGQSLNALANAHTKLGQWKKAEAACLRILELNPNDGPGLNLLAQALRHQGRWKDARETVARILAQMPNNAFGHANAGYAALAAGDHLRANEHFRESLRMDPHFDLARRGLIQSLQARVWLIRFNLRVTAWVRRPPTLLNVTVSLLALAAIFAAMLYASILLDRFFPHTGSLIGCFFLLPLFYIYLLIIVRFMSNFLLIFDPIGRHALTQQEKVKACLPALILVTLILAHAWTVAAGVFAFLLLIAATIQIPLLKDRWQRRRENQSD